MKYGFVEVMAETVVAVVRSSVLATPGVSHDRDVRAGAHLLTGASQDGGACKTHEKIRDALVKTWETDC